MTVPDHHLLAKLRIEVEEAQNHLIDLQKRALQMAEALQKAEGPEEVVDTIQQNCALEPSVDSFDDSKRFEYRLSPRFVSHPDFTTWLKMLDDLKRARQNVFNVRRRNGLSGLV